MEEQEPSAPVYGEGVGESEPLDDATSNIEEVTPPPYFPPITWKDYVWPIFTIVIVLALDQILKIWVKLNMDQGVWDEKHLWGNRALLHFTENNGIAFGWEFGEGTGKFLLTTFRLIASGFIMYYLIKFIKDHASKGIIISFSFIFAGAFGNIIDSVFYGVWFKDINEYVGGYFHGKVVDMLYFPLLQGNYPEWFPFWKGEEYIFFRPIFNIADASISIGVLLIIIFFRKGLKNH